MAAKKKVAKKSAQEKGKPEAKEPKVVKPKAPVHAATAVEVEEQAPGKPKDEAKGKNGFLNRKAKKGPETKKEKPSVDLEPLKKKVLEAEGELTKAKNEANALHMQAKGVEEAAKKAYAEVLAPYREACRKAGVKCEFSGGHSASVSERVRFIVEKAEGGIRVMIEGRPETDEVITTKALKESINKAAYAYTEKHLGPKEKIGNKGGGLSNRLRKVFENK